MDVASQPRDVARAVQPPLAEVRTGRSLLVFDPGEQMVRTAVPTLTGWTLVPATSYEQVVKLSSDQSLRVGIARFPDENPDAFAEIATSLVRTTCRMLWIALVSPKLAVQSTSKAMRVIAESFYDYHTDPVDERRLEICLGHAEGMSRLLDGVVGEGQAAAEQQMVGSSEVMRRLFQLIRRVAGVDAPVFIAGESGTGKELTARAIHERSHRAKGPFITIDCGSLPATLIQSELFGYEKGAFTGASHRKVGKLQAASGGTLFLDEIGDLPLDLQGNLLRFLQESTIQRIGGTESIPVDVRVIAASHVDLEKAVQRGTFREDLYFRLCVLNLKVPPLRERENDVQLLAQFFFSRFAPESNRNVKGISPRALEAMLGHDWPGNVRELINRVRRAIVMCEGALLTPADLGLDRRKRRRSAGIPSLEAARVQAEQEALRLALRMCGDNLSEVARVLAVSRVTLYRLMRRHKDLIGGQQGAAATRRTH